MKNIDKNLIEKGRTKTLIIMALICILILGVTIYEAFFTIEGLTIINAIRTLIAFYAMYNIYKGDTIAYIFMIISLGIVIGLVISSILYAILDLIKISEVVWANIVLWLVTITSTISLLFKSKTIREINEFVKYQEKYRR